MWVMIVIPKPAYLSLIRRFEPENPVCVMLKNGFIVRTPIGEIVAILCRSEQAKTTLNLVAQTAAEILPAIKQIHLPPDM